MKIIKFFISSAFAVACFVVFMRWLKNPDLMTPRLVRLWQATYQLWLGLIEAIVGFAERF